jgi:fructose-bisphosphate aldolase, class I
MYNIMQDTINKLVVKEKGILAIDESIGTIGKRFAAINLENTEANRHRYRSLIANTNNLSNYISGIILFEETLYQKIFNDPNILIGIKVDQGLTNIYPNNDEKITKGLDTLIDTLSKYRQDNLDIKFAKWRSVISIDPNKNWPSKVAIQLNTHGLARYAAICQAFEIVPIVEPEVLMDGEHDLEQCSLITEKVLLKVFKALRKHNVSLEHMILKTNMILPGLSCNKKYDLNEIATETIKVLKRTVPAAVPSINFLSGGQTESQATSNLNAINKQGIAPWHLSFSFGRALQETCIKTWQGQDANIAAAQAALLNRARLNSLANLGQAE